MSRSVRARRVRGSKWKEMSVRRFQKRLLSLMRLALTSPKERRSGKVEIGLVRLSLSRYSATEVDPLRPLSPVSSVNDILLGEMLFAVTSVRYHKRVRALGGIFRVDRSRRIVPEGSEDQGVEVHPIDLDNHKTLRRELLDDLEENKESARELIHAHVL